MSIINFLNFIFWFILCYLTFVSLVYIFLLLATIVEVLNKFLESQEGNISCLMKKINLPPVTLLVPTYNEEKSVMETIYSIIKSDYPNKFIIIINDGSTDGTLKVLTEKLALHSVTPIIPTYIPIIGEITGQYISKLHQNIIVIDKKNGGTGDALNVGVNASRTPMFISIDADTLIEPKAVSELVFKMLSQPHTLAVGGSVYLLNGCRYKDGEILEEKIPSGLVSSIQILEYLGSFSFNRLGWNILGGAMSFSGANTLFERKAVLEIGGFQTNSNAQDFEVITHLHKHSIENHFPYRIDYTPTAATWTDVPSTFKEYWNQRSNWQIGSLKSLLTHKAMLFNPKYGKVGLFNYPFYLFVEVLGCVVEFIGYIAVFTSWYIGILSFSALLMYLALCWGILALLSMTCVLMNVITYNKYKRLRYVPIFLLLSIFQTVGFRQFDVLCRVTASLKYFWLSLKNRENKKNLS
ncbi:MAG TPA: glycosyltransferase [Gammaproteobacteria bacterium]|nr:glycosyltransferase [Gammaproteobacteria bacterium]